MKHPGKIELVDEAKGTSKIVDAKTAPDSVAFVDGKPVVKVIHSMRGDEHVIRSYGEDGALLSTTVT